MNNDLDAILDNAIKEREVEVSVADMKLSCIFDKYYNKFRTIQLSYTGEFNKKNSEFNSYTKKIQSILTQIGKFQKDGSPISEYQILNEMHRVRKQKGLIGSSTTENDNQGSVLSPTSDLNGSGVVKVSTKQKKPSNGVKGELVPIKPVDMVKETEKIKFEMRQYNVNKVPLVWSAEDEYMYIQWKDLAERKLAKIPRLKFNRLLEPAWDNKVEDYFSAWISKASHFKPDCI